jgi:hypothetical protein
MISLIIFYILLVAFSYLIFRNCVLIWKLNKDFTFPIGTLIIYYFTLGGAFIFPIDAFTGFKGGSIGLHYFPIFERLFYVSFDTDYFISCGYYILFILVFQYTYILFVKRYTRINDIDFNQKQNLPYEVVINPYMVLAVSLSCIFVSAFIMRHEIYYAIAHENSVYLITRANNNPHYTIHQLANEFSALIPFIAYSFTIIKTNRFNIKVSDKKSSFYILLTACFIASLYISFLGNRREILSGLVICILIGLNQFKNIYFKRLAYIFTIVLFMFLGSNFFRSRVIPWELNSILHLEQKGHMKEEFTEEVFGPRKGTNGEPVEAVRPNANLDARGTIGSLLFSNELFYAHFSMYGAVHKKIPLTYGSSYLYLITSVIPRAIYPNRPADIYGYYAESVDAAPGQIYTIHHATACYLNFGFPGIIFGGMVLGGLFVFAFFLNFYSFKRNSTFLILLKYLISFLICGQLVTFITAGPEAYKSMILEGILIPVILLWLCTKKIIPEKSNSNI